jgi:hypothetical protein
MFAVNVRFDDPNLTGSMEVSISFRKVSVRTELHIEQTGIPDAKDPCP